MPTDFLNRRMDLIHSVEATGIGDVNYLTMDTSYPVKLAGKVLKIFKASNVYNDGMWVIVNAAGNGILTIPSDEIYDFCGNVIERSVGEEKLYPTPSDVYAADDYVVIIIDFDNECAKLCSQTMFNYIYTNVGVSDVNLKMFDISGVDSVPGIDNPLSQEEFERAVSFESGDGTFSFVRRNNSDKVVFQAPELQQDGTYRYVPVADVDNKNINGFNVSALPLLYPSLNTGYSESFNTVDAVRSLTQLNGKINQKFIDDFCYEWSEIQTLMATMGDAFNGYGKSFYQNIPDGDKNKYLYYIRQSGDFAKYSQTISGRNDSQAVIPIYKDSLKFSTVEFNGPGVITNMELNWLYSQLSGYMVSNWWKNGFKTSQEGSGAWSTPATLPYADDGEAEVYTFDMTDVSDAMERRFLITDYIDTVPNILSQGETYYEDMDLLGVSILSPSTSYLVPMSGAINIANLFVDNEELVSVANYISFFGNNDNAYKEYIKTAAFRGAFQKGPYVFRKKSSLSMDAPCPIRVAMIFPEYIDEYVNIRDNTLYNLSDNGNINKNYLKYVMKNESFNSAEAYMLAYLMKFYPAAVINHDEYNLNILKNSFNEIRKYIDPDNNERRFRFTVSGDYMLRSDTEDHRCPFGLVTHVDSHGNLVNYLITQFLKMMPRAIACNDKTNNKLLADLSFVNKMYYTSVKFAKANFDDHLEFIQESGTWYLTHIKYNGGTPEPTPLYLTKYSNNDLTTVRASYAEVAAALQYNGTVFLYMGETSTDLATTSKRAYRIRYFTDFKTVAQYGNHSSDPNDAITSIDFFTDSLEIYHQVDDPSNFYIPNLYSNALAASLSNITTEAQMKSTLNSMALTDAIAAVEKTYYLYYSGGNGYGILNNLDANGIPSIVRKVHPTLRYVADTVSIAMKHDITREYRSCGDMKLTDIFPTGTSLYQDGPAPMLSKIKDNSGSFIVNSSSYIDFISNVFITKETENIENNVTGNATIPALLSEQQLKYVNGVGICEEYYKNKSILDFLNYITMYNVTEPSETQRNDQISKQIQSIFAKGAFDGIVANDQYTDFKDGFDTQQKSFATNARFTIPTGTYVRAYSSSSASQYSSTLNGDGTTLYKVDNATQSNNRVQISHGSSQYWVAFSDIAISYTGFKDGNGNQVRLNSPASIISEINFRNNRYGFNESYIYAGTSTNAQDLTSSYISIDKMYASVERAGEKEVTNLSLSDDQGILLNLNGILGDLEIDDITWENLMTALCSNKTINVLGLLKTIKSQLNLDITIPAQNVTDEIAYSDNIDNVANIGTKADFDPETNLYTYHDGEGYSGNVKEMNSRGVIVLVSEGGRTTLVNGVPVTTNSTIHLKRMYISKDGLLCTKAFYDAEKTLGKSLLERLHDLDHLG